MLFSRASAVLLIIAAAPVSAQLAGKSVSEDSGPVSEVSRTVSDGSRPVYESGRSTHESSVGSLSGNSARESSIAPVKSGAVSAISAGTVTSDRSLRRERLAPAPPRIVWEDVAEVPVQWQPVHDLDPVIDTLSAIQPMEPYQEDAGSAGEEPATDTQ